MTANFEATDACAAKNANNTDNAAALCARDAWSPGAGHTAGNLPRLDMQMNSRLALIQSNDDLLNAYLNSVKDSGLNISADSRSSSKIQELFAALPSDRTREHAIVNERAQGGDSRLEKVDVQSVNEGSVSVREYRGLDRSYTKDRLASAKDKIETPDATVIIPKAFDPNKPVRVMIFNHGLGASGKDWATSQELARQMAAADPNTIMVIPEWQSKPGDGPGKPRNGHNPENSIVYGQNFFRDQLQQIMHSTPELRGKTVDDIASIGIISHSGGFKASKAQLENNGFGDKVTSVTVLDSMYAPDSYNSWLKANAQDLASGRKHFTVVETGGRPDNGGPTWKEQLEANTRKSLGQYQVPDTSYDKYGRNANDPSAFERGGVVFLRNGDHKNLPRNFVARVLEGEKRLAVARR